MTVQPVDICEALDVHDIYMQVKGFCPYCGEGLKRETDERP